jgi:Pregnancy-associated plasma protein-A
MDYGAAASGQEYSRGLRTVRVGEARGMEECPMTGLRRPLTLLAASVLLAASAAPAVAITAASKSEGAPAWACGPDGGGISARGGFADSRGVIREKDTGQVARELPQSAQGAAPASLSVSVPTYFHVITSGSLGSLTDRQIRNQMAVMNSAYSGTGFSFALAGVTRTNNATWYASRSGGAEHAMKQALKAGGDGDLNVYTTSGGAYLGWAYLPEITDTAQRYLDGIVMDWRTVPGASTEYDGVYDEGDTLVHEAGHWLNLEHTFFGQCNKAGDFVDDTPPQKSPSFGCPAGKDTCPAPGVDSIHNFMDYSDDPCLTEFTAGQGQRMRDAWLRWRA